MIPKAVFTGVLAAVLALSACSKPGDRMLFDGNYYPVKIKKGQTREAFSVTVRRIDQGINGARKAGKTEATRYCIETVGDSTITWQRGPDGQGGNLVTDRGNLVLTGHCVKW